MDEVVVAAHGEGWMGIGALIFSVGFVRMLRVRETFYSPCAGLY